MISLLSTLYRDYLDNENLCCFLCDEQGTIRRLGRGLLMRYPHIFKKGRAFTEYYAAEEETDQLMADLIACESSVTPPFQIFGDIFFLCLFTVLDPETQKRYILGILEQVPSAPDSTSAPRYQEQLSEMNTELLQQIAESCHNLSKPGMAENAARCSEALQRNHLLLKMLEQTVKFQKSDGHVHPGQLCIALQKQLQMTQDSLPLHTTFQITVSDRKYYLNTDQFIEMLFSVITIYAISGKESNLYLTLQEEDGVFSLQTIASAAAVQEEHQLLIDCLYEVIRRFALQYGGGASFITGDHSLSIRITFSPAVDDSEEDGYFENNTSDFAAIDRLLPLLRYANR